MRWPLQAGHALLDFGSVALLFMAAPGAVASHVVAFTR